jgi:hypothetical protein
MVLVEIGMSFDVAAHVLTGLQTPKPANLDVPNPHAFTGPPIRVFADVEVPLLYDIPMSSDMLNATQLFLNKQLTSTMTIDTLMFFLVKCMCYYADNKTSLKRLKQRVADNILNRDDGLAPQALMPGTTTRATAEILSEVSPKEKVTREQDEKSQRGDPEAQINSTVLEAYEIKGILGGDPGFVGANPQLASIFTNPNLDPTTIQQGTTSRMYCYMSGARVFRLTDNRPVVTYLPEISTNNVEHIKAHLQAAMESLLPSLNKWDNLDMLEKIVQAIQHCTEYRASAQFPNAIIKADHRLSFGFKGGHNYFEGADLLTICILLGSMCITNSGTPLFNLSTLAASGVPITFPVTVGGAPVVISSTGFTTETLYTLIADAPATSQKATADLLRNIAEQGMNAVLTTVAGELTTSKGVPDSTTTPVTKVLVQAMSEFVKRRLPEIIATVTNTCTAANIFLNKDNRWKLTMLAAIAGILESSGEKALTAAKLSAAKKKLAKMNKSNPTIPGDSEDLTKITADLQAMFYAPLQMPEKDFMNGLYQLNRASYTAFNERASTKLLQTSDKTGFTQIYNPEDIQTVFIADPTPIMGVFELTPFTPAGISEHEANEVANPDTDAEIIAAVTDLRSIISTAEDEEGVANLALLAHPPIIVMDVANRQFMLLNGPYTLDNGKEVPPGTQFNINELYTHFFNSDGQALRPETPIYHLLPTVEGQEIQMAPTIVDEEQLTLNDLPAYLPTIGWDAEAQTAGRRRRHKTHKRSKRTKRRKTAKRRLLKLK